MDRDRIDRIVALSRKETVQKPYHTRVMQTFPTQGTWAEQKRWHRQFEFMNDLRNATKYAIGSNAYEVKKSIAKPVKNALNKID